MYLHTNYLKKYLPSSYVLYLPGLKYIVPPVIDYLVDTALEVSVCLAVRAINFLPSREAPSPMVS